MTSATPSFSLLNSLAAEVGEDRVMTMCQEYLASVREKRAGIAPPAWRPLPLDLEARAGAQAQTQENPWATSAVAALRALARRQPQGAQGTQETAQMAWPCGEGDMDQTPALARLWAPRARLAQLWAAPSLATSAEAALATPAQPVLAQLLSSLPKPEEGTEADCKSLTKPITPENRSSLLAFCQERLQDAATTPTMVKALERAVRIIKTMDQDLPVAPAAVAETPRPELSVPTDDELYS